MSGSVSKEGIGYEEKVLTFLLLGSYDCNSAGPIDFSTNVKTWEINPKLFNSKLLGIPFSIDIDFFIKKGSIYHVFFAKSSRKLAKKTRYEYLMKAFSTFCALESQKKKFEGEDFVYYYVSDSLPWEWIQEMPAMNNSKIAERLKKITGVSDGIFLDENIAFVKQKTRPIELTEQTIRERKARFGLRFDKKLAEVSQAKRYSEQFVLPTGFSPSYDIIFGDDTTGRPYKINGINVWIGRARGQFVKAASEFERSGKQLKVVGGLAHMNETYHKAEDFTEAQALDVITDLFNEIILPEENCRDVSLLITANNYNVVFFRHKELSDIICKEIDLATGVYDLSKADVLKDLDPRNQIRIAIISFLKGRGLGITEHSFKVSSIDDSEDF